MQISDQICRCHKDWKSARSNWGWAIPAPEQQTWKPGRTHLSCDTSGRRRAAVGGCSSCTLWSWLGEMLPPGGTSRASPATLLRLAAPGGSSTLLPCSSIIHPSCLGSQQEGKQPPPNKQSSKARNRLVVPLHSADMGQATPG